VVNDRDFRIWNAYRVPGWPTQIVIDPEGHHLMGFVGENHYDRINQLVKATIDLHRQRGTLREEALFLEAVPRECCLGPISPLRGLIGPRAEAGAPHGPRAEQSHDLGARRDNPAGIA
jgi:hypothetical protein